MCLIFDEQLTRNGCVTATIEYSVHAQFIDRNPDYVKKFGRFFFIRPVATTGVTYRHNQPPPVSRPHISRLK